MMNLIITFHIFANVPQVVLLQTSNAQIISQQYISEEYPLYIIYTPTCFDITMSSSGSFAFVPCLLTYSMVQSPSWEANWFAASQEIPRILWNPKVHYRTHKRPPPVAILGQPNPVHIPTSHLMEIHPNIIHPSTPRSPQWSLSLRFPHQDPIRPPLLTHMPPHAQPIPFLCLAKLHKYWMVNQHLVLWRALVVHTDRLENWFWVPVWLRRPDYCPLMGHNPGLLLTCLLDITPWEDYYTGCPRRNVPDFGRVFLMLKYTDVTQNTYVHSWTVLEIMPREVWNFDSCYTLIDYQIHIKNGRNMWFL